MSVPYTIKLEDRGEYIYVLVGGDKLTPEISASYWREIAGACFETNKNRIMIEKDFAETVSAAEMVMMGEYLGKLLPNYKIAFIDRHGNQNINELGKKIARNREVKMQLFNDTEEARQWLMVN